MARKKISYKRNGDKYFKENNYGQALIWYNLGLQINPHNFNLMVSAANVYFKILDTYTALPLYYRAIKKAKKIKTFQIFINKIQKGQIINYNSFTQILHKTHKLIIEPSAIPFIISYIQDIQQIEKLEKKYERFKEIFEKNTIKDIKDLIDKYIMYCNLYPFQQDIYMLHRTANEKGYNIDINQLFQTIQYRRQYWNQIYTTNTDITPLIKMMDKMTGEEFEKIIKLLFQMQGYQCKITKKTKDKGGDIIAKNPYETIAIQCKRWKQKIGTDAIQQAHAAKTIYNTTKAMVITNNYFTNDAIKNAKILKIELWDRNQLIQKLLQQLK